MTILNNSGMPITIERMFAHWVESPSSQKIDRLLLDGAIIWDIASPHSPSDIPGQNMWQANVDRTIVASSGDFVIDFQDPLQASGYEVHIVFDIGCQVVGTR
jgi:hypothetical protein